LRRVESRATSVLAGAGLEWLRSFAVLRMTSSAVLSFADASLRCSFLLSSFLV